MECDNVKDAPIDAKTNLTFYDSKSDDQNKNCKRNAFKICKKFVKIDDQNKFL